MTYYWDTSGKDLRRVRVGETISYGGGDIPYVDKVVEITPDTPKPDSTAINEIKFLRAALEEREREVERMRDALRGCEAYFAKGVKFGKVFTQADEEMLGLVRDAFTASEAREGEAREEERDGPV